MNLCREKTGREDASQHATTKKCLSGTPRARKTAGQQREDPRRLECHFALFRNRPHQRKFEVVVFWALDRFSRQGTRATINYLHELESYGVGFVSYTERYLDSTGIFRDALIGLLAALANQEGIRLSDRVKAGMARTRIEGKHVGRPRLDDRTRRQVRELRAQNPDMSIRAIERETEVPYATTRRLLLEREKPPGN